VPGGDRSTLTGGDASTLTGGDRSTLTGGYRSTLTIAWWDNSAARKRRITFYAGEDGIEVNVPYRLNPEHRPERVAKPAEAGEGESR
jgi:hypothetical protein